MSGHAPGRPWRLRGGRLRPVVYVEDARGRPVCEVLGPARGGSRDRAADARLIAAAPEMAAAMEEAVRECEVCRSERLPERPEDDPPGRCARCRTFLGVLRDAGLASS